MSELELRIATKNDELKADLMAQIINHVYDVSEGNIWINDYKRTSKGQLIKLIRSGELLLAVKGNEFYGCVWLEKVNNETYKFKMLVANPVYKGTGIGSKLVKYAEKQAKEQGACKMQLELLVPTEFEHVDKVILTQWYTRIGYWKIAEHEIDYVHQGISAYLKTECIAQVYEKTL